MEIEEHDGWGRGEEGDVVLKKRKKRLQTTALGGQGREGGPFLAVNADPAM